MRNLISLALLFIAFSCQEILYPDNRDSTPTEVFETLWKTLDEGYSFFNYKNINWDEVYQQYRPMIDDEMTDRALFDVCSQMLLTLKDAHVNLRAGFEISYFDYYTNAPGNFNPEMLERTYWKGFSITGPLLHTVLDDVGYIYYRRFSTPFTDAQLDVVVERFNNVPGLKGVIIDVRSNEGGNPANGYRFLRRIMDERTLLYRTIYKDGPEHDAFTSPEEDWLEPNKEDHPSFSGKIAVLTNRKCYSACNFFVAASKAFSDRLIVVGDTTGGGGGQPNGFELPNGWSVNFSGSITALPDGFIIEHGVPPDIEVNMDPQEESAGIDTIIETALSEIRQ